MPIETGPSADACADRGPARDAIKEHLVILVREFIATEMRAGATLPPVGKLAERLELPPGRAPVLKDALRFLDASGDIAFHSTQRPRALVLDPMQLHPDDVDLAQEIEQGITSGRFQRGNALPSGLLGRKHGLEADQVRRACRLLIRRNLLAYLPDGPHGPGLYVTAPATTPLPAQAQRAEMSHER